MLSCGVVADVNKLRLAGLGDAFWGWTVGRRGLARRGEVLGLCLVDSCEGRGTENTTVNSAERERTALLYGLKLLFVGCFEYKQSLVLKHSN